MKPAEHVDLHWARHHNGFGVPVRVYYQDTDAGGVVYHSTYLNFMERARYEWLRHMGFGARELAARQVIFVIRSLQVEYLKPARLDDLLQVTVAVAETGRSRVGLEQRILRDHALLLRARVEAVCVHGETFRPMSIPADIRHRFQATAR
ncbi:MAG: tol-pal system-associated acyl-CoA thioesterase [Betaproteobacteria bacterium]|nr:tol-pal system-associated acyl-CoA thioesterase [Betaproteobacteria bacterium]